MNNNTQPNTPIHTHAVPPLELQAVGGAMRLGRRKNDGLDAMRQQVLSSAVARRILQQLDDIPLNSDMES
jgi:hypothetical protein